MSDYLDTTGPTTVSDFVPGAKVEIFHIDPSNIPNWDMGTRISGMVIDISPDEEFLDANETPIRVKLDEPLHRSPVIISIIGDPGTEDEYRRHFLTEESRPLADGKVIDIVHLSVDVVARVYMDETVDTEDDTLGGK